MSMLQQFDKWKMEVHWSLNFSFNNPSVFFFKLLSITFSSANELPWWGKIILKDKTYFLGENTENRDWDLSHLNQHVSRRVLIVFSLRLIALMNAQLPFLNDEGLLLNGTHFANFEARENKRRILS